MVSVGSMEMAASINTAGLERGFQTIKRGFSSMGAYSKSVNADFERLTQQTSKFRTILAVAAGAGIGLIASLAKGAPALSGAFARIQVASQKLGFAIGEALKPAVDWFAGKLEDFTNWATTHPDLFGGLVYSIGGLVLALAAFKIGAAFSAFFTWLLAPATLAGLWSVSLVLGIIASTIGALKIAAKIPGAINDLIQGNPLDEQEEEIHAGLKKSMKEGDIGSWLKYAFRFYFESKSKKDMSNEGVDGV
jgi:hypothetical protein